MDSRPYADVLTGLARRADLRTVAPDDVAALVVGWLEDKSDAFGDGWNRLLDVALIWNSGDLMDDAVPMTRILVQLASHLTGRRLAWILADLDSSAEVLEAYLLHWADDPDLSELGHQVGQELIDAEAACIVALRDTDFRARGYSASLMAQLARKASHERARQALEDAAIAEREPVAATTMRLALSTWAEGVARSTVASRRGASENATALSWVDDEVVADFDTAASISTAWGKPHPRLPAILGNALVMRESGQHRNASREDSRSDG